MADDLKSFTSPEKIAEAGERIYAEQKSQLEAAHLGQFGAIDVLAGTIYLGSFPEEAIDKARQAAPTGVFHLVRIGAAGAYHVSHLLHGEPSLAR